MGNECAKYVNDMKAIPPNICVIHFCFCNLYCINIPEEIKNSMLVIYTEVWGKNAELKDYNQQMFRLRPHKPMFYAGADSLNSANSKQMVCRFQKLFCQHGWSLVNSPTLTFESSLSSWFFYKEINPYMVNSGGVDDEFCVIGLSSYSDLQFIDFPESLEAGIIQFIKSIWIKGASDPKKDKKNQNFWTLDLNGSPWRASGEESIEARFLVLSIIRFMSQNNWRLVNSTAMKPDACDTMFFRKFANAFDVSCPDTMPDYYFMLALMGTNYISVLGANASLQKAVADSCQRHEPKGIKPIEMKKNYPAVVLISDVWKRRNEHEIETRKLMTLIFQDLAAVGWMPVESIDCTRSLHDLSSIVFVRIPPVRMMYFCLCPRKYNGICLVNAVDEVQNIVFNTFQNHYTVDPQTMTKSAYGSAVSIDFRGNPYRGSDRYASLLFLHALSATICALKDEGWFLVVSADTSTETKTVQRGNNSETIKWSIYGLWFSKVIGS